MIPAAFEYHTPKTLDDALKLLERHGDEAKVLAGGHSLLPAMKMRLAAPRYVVDIGKLRGLSYVRSDGETIAIGAMTTHSEIESAGLLHSRCPLLPETASHIGDVQVRNRGTIGGSLAHADPAADYPAAVLALDAQLVLMSSSGPRTVTAREFFVDLLTTQLRPGEILTEIRVPGAGKREGQSYAKLHQLASGYAIVGVAARIVLAGSGKVESAAVGVTGAAPKAYRAEAVEKALVGKKPDAKNIAEAARSAAKGIDALADLHASSEYRREMAVVFARRAIARAAARALGKKG